MGLAEYMIIGKGAAWSVLHDGETNGDYATKGAAFEAAVAAATIAVHQGHEVHLAVPSREADAKTALGAKENV